MRVSPGPSTRTWPPLNAAISEFVVPKSIPAIRSLIFFSRRRTRNLHLRRSKQFSIPFVTAAVNLDHRAFGNGARFLAIDGVHPPRIERLPFTGNFARVEFLQGLIQSLESQLVPFLQGCQRCVGGIVLGRSGREKKRARQPRGAAFEISASLARTDSRPRPSRSRRSIKTPSTSLRQRRSSHAAASPSRSAKRLACEPSVSFNSLKDLPCSLTSCVRAVMAAHKE